MSTNHPTPATQRSRFLWIGASLCAVTFAGGAALYAATDDDPSDAKTDAKTTVTTTTVSYEDPLVTRYGQP